jgi:5-(aminomethyl)-3-furanmethanol phosphate kinase
MEMRVVKVGGSLFQQADLAERLMRWLNQQPAKNSVFVAGGGRLADEVRLLDQRFQLDPRETHELAIRTMTIHARVLASQLGYAEPLSGLPEIQRWSASDSPVRFRVVDAESLLGHDQQSRHHEPLPCSWDVTSDSLAARIAHLLKASELVLLKSTLPEQQVVVDCAEAARSGFVDPYLARAARGIELLRAVNLLDTAWGEIRLAIH